MKENKKAAKATDEELKEAIAEEDSIEKEEEMAKYDDQLDRRTPESDMQVSEENAEEVITPSVTNL